MTPITEHQFHAVWTAAVGRPGYDKKFFQDLLGDMIDKGLVIPTNHSNNNNQPKKMKATIIKISVAAVLLIAFIMWMLPTYRVWAAGMRGEAELRRATFNRQVKVKEAEADFDAAVWHVKRDTVQAYGIARSNAIIGMSLVNNEPYLVFRWIEKLSEISGHGQTIYVPGGMAPLPITEAYRLQQPNPLTVQPHE